MSVEIPISIRCAWCGRGAPDGPNVSHTICAACNDAQKRQAQREDEEESCCEDPRSDGLCCREVAR